MSVINEVATSLRGSDPSLYSHVDLAIKACLKMTMLAWKMLTPSFDMFDVFLVAMDPLNMYRRKKERLVTKGPISGNPFAELTRVLGGSEVCRYLDLEFAAPAEWVGEAESKPNAKCLQGFAGNFSRMNSEWRVPALVTFASRAPGIELARNKTEVKQAVDDLIESLRVKYGVFRHEPTARLPSKPLSRTDPRVVELRYVGDIEAVLPIRTPCCVASMCTRRSEFSEGPT